MSKEKITYYKKRFLVSMWAYAVTILGSAYYLRHTEEGAFDLLISISPMIPIVFGTISMVRAVREMDELERAIEQEAMAVSALAVGLLSFSYGFLENVGFPKLDVIYILPAMLLGWGFAKIAIKRRYL